MDAHSAITAVQETSGASLSRTLSHIQNRETAMVTANRQDASPEENRSANDALRMDIRRAGLGFIQTQGVGQEEVDGQVRAVREPSFLVINQRPDGQPIEDFREWVTELGNKYNQYAVLYGDGSGKAELVICSSGVTDMTFSSMRIGSGQFYTQLHNARSFRFESLDFVQSSGLMESRARIAKGELIHLRNEDTSALLTRLVG